MNTSLFSRIKVYSIGASNENHGPAIPSNIDDLFAKRTSVIVCERTGADYRMHLPYSGDGVGNIAKDWNPGFMYSGTMVSYITRDIKYDVMRQRNLLGSHRTVKGAVIISGHGGNNFLGHADILNHLSKHADIPVIYIPPLDGIYADHPLGRLIPSHADDSEHSIALYMGVLNQKGLEEITELARKDVYEVIKKWPELMGLAGYVLPSGGERYNKLRELAPGLIEMANKFLERKSIIVDRSCGEELFNKNVDVTVRKIIGFAEKI